MSLAISILQGQSWVAAKQHMIHEVLPFGHYRGSLPTLALDPFLNKIVSPLGPEIKYTRISTSGGETEETLKKLLQEGQYV